MPHAFTAEGKEMEAYTSLGFFLDANCWFLLSTAAFGSLKIPTVLMMSITPFAMLHEIRPCTTDIPFVSTLNFLRIASFQYDCSSHY